ncbi:MAG TPA: autotransporter-associated beta strand repeat-containing protein, partial [Verrucomicrobiae bacterium]
GTGTFTYNTGGNVKLTANGAYTIANNVVEARDFYFYGNNLTFSGSWTHNNGKTLTINGGLTVTLAGGLAQGANTLNVSGSGTLALNGATTGSGGIQVNGGTLSLGNAQALGTGTLTFNGGSLDCSVANLVNANNNAENWNANFAFGGSRNLNLGTGAVTLNANRTVTVNASTLTIGGVIGGNYSLTKAGAGALALTATNSYSGGTIISNGIFAASGQLGSGVVTVAGGTLAPGGNGVIGALVISNSLLIQAGGTLAVDINKTAGANDQISGLTSVTFGGTLAINNLSGSLSTNDSFKLFSAGSYSGAFAGITPATPGVSLAWNTNTLAIDGTLRVASTWAPQALAVAADPMSYDLYETQVAFTGGADLRVGASNATTPGGRNAVYIFALPAIGANSRVASATLSFACDSTSGTPWFNLDLWGLGFVGDNQPILNCYLGGTTDTNSANTLLQSNILAQSTALGPVTSSDLTAYLNTFYTNNGGYVSNTNSGTQGTMYLFLRLNPNVEPGNAVVGYNVSGPDNTNPPMLNLATAYNDTPPAPANFVAVAGNGQVSLSWSPAAGASTYHVKKRRFSGDPYVVIASTTGTNFTDAGLVNGPTCRYVVCGVNTNGEGAYSPEALVIPYSPMTFMHPGLLHGQADLNRMKQMVAQGIEPWASDFLILSNDSYSAQTYSIQWQSNFYNIDTNSYSQANNDAIAAYQQALMWSITSNSVYARKAIQILNDWSSSVTNMERDVLRAAIFSAKFVNAAELMRYSNAGWAATNMAQFSVLLTNVFYPLISDFATFANGNWDATCEKAMAGM